MALVGMKTSLLGTRAPEFPKALPWLNSEPLDMAGLKGKVVLIDFWTYSCVNCLRTQPFIKKWHEEYASHGLVVVGVHTPEFVFEKSLENVKRAVEDLGIQYPVVLDADYKIWNLYANHWWPRKLLVSKQGKIIYDHVGEGGYRETEVEIQKALRTGLATPLAFPPVEEEHVHRESGGVCYRTTPELYLGHERGYIGNPKGFSRDVPVLFQDATSHKRHMPYLAGQWLITSEYLEHARETRKFEDYLLLPFGALQVNLVMRSKDPTPIPLSLSLDGKPLAQDHKGTDVVLSNGQSVTEVSTPHVSTRKKPRVLGGRT